MPRLYRMAETLPRHDCLEPLGLNVTEAAKRLGVSRKQLSGIVNCHVGISPDLWPTNRFWGGQRVWFRDKVSELEIF